LHGPFRTFLALYGVIPFRFDFLPAYFCVIPFENSAFGMKAIMDMLICAYKCQPMKKLINQYAENSTVVFIAQTTVLIVWTVLILLTLALFASACSNY
jgi:hypothetical protein